MIKSSVWAFFVVRVLLALGSCDIDTVCNNKIIVAIARRPSNDIQYKCNTTNCHCPCCDDATYLVTGQQCVNNTDLFNGKI